jgi:hypothetical protein
MNPKDKNVPTSISAVSGFGFSGFLSLLSFEFGLFLSSAVGRARKSVLQPRGFETLSYSRADLKRAA